LLYSKRDVDDFQNIALSESHIISKSTFTMMAGPCAAESRDQVFRTADALAEIGIKVFRAGCFKSRTDPYAWQGSQEEGLKWLDEVRQQYGMKIISEITSFTNYAVVAECSDIIQIGAKAMYDHSLLIESGKAKKPVLVKRGFGTTVTEYLRMIEYILMQGNNDVILCERGIRTFETSTRFTLDLCGAVVMQDVTRLPLICDPSHAAGKAKYVSKLAMAAAALGCDGLIIEVHHNPSEALCDRDQALTIVEYKELHKRISEIVEINGRKII